MELISFVATAIGFLSFYTAFGLRYIHILQLNSYRYERYYLWHTKNKSRLFAYLSLLSLASLAGYDWGGRVVFLTLAFLFLITTPFKRKKAKTPLVYTARVKRLLLIYILLGIVLLFVSYVIKENILLSVVVLFMGAFLSPHLVTLALFISSPVEKGISRYYYNDAKKILESKKDLIIIGVTGSFGKTSMKNIVYGLLSEKYEVLMTPGNFNTTLGVVRTIREHLKPTHQVFVVEMGAKNKGDIKEICDLVKPHFGVISSLGPQHLESFKTIETIIDTKFELADAVWENGGTMFLNYSNDFIKNHPTEGKTVTFGLSEDADYAAKDMKYSSKGAEFSVNGIEIKTALLGEFSSINIAGGIAVAEHLGVTGDAIKTAAKRLTAPEHRLKLIKHPAYTIIDDAYNSNPEGAKAALKTLSLFSERKILVTPGMVELGAEEFNLNKEFGRMAAHSADYIVLVGKKQAPPMEEGIKEEGFPSDKLYIAENINDAFAYLNKITDVPSVVLLENDLPDNFL